MLTKVHVSHSSELDSRLNQLMNQSQTTDNQTMAQIQHHSNQIKQEIQKTLESTETPTLSHQLDHTDLKAGATSHAIAVLPTMLHGEACMDRTTSSISRAQTVPASHHPITNRPVAVTHCWASGPWQFNQPHYIAVDSAGMMYVSNRSNYDIHKMNSGGDYVTHWGTVGIQPGPLAVIQQFNELVCALLKQNLRQESSNKAIIYSLEGHVKKEFTIGMDGIVGIAVNSRSQIVCCTTNKAISVVTRDGDILHMFGSKGSGPGQFDYLKGVCIGPDDDIIVVHVMNRYIEILDHQGQFKRQFGTKGEGNGQFKNPGHVAVDQYHQILVGDYGRKDVQVFSYTGEFIRCTDSRVMSGPSGLAVTQDHHVLVTDFNSHCIFKFKYM